MRSKGTLSFQISAGLKSSTGIEVIGKHSETSVTETVETIWGHRIFQMTRVTSEQWMEDRRLLRCSIRRWRSLVHGLSVLGHPLAVALVRDGSVVSLLGFHLLVDQPDCVSERQRRVR